MDRRDLESDDGLHANLGRLRPLLRPHGRADQDAGALSPTAACLGLGREPRGSVCSEVLGRPAIAPALLEGTAAGLCEQHVRRFSRELHVRYDRTRVRGDARGTLAPVPATYQASRESPALRRPVALVSEYLDRHFD